ncbi:NapC/NirT family cytochrome c [Sansalvadorimonas sp. 2012CJ34-2]|uniref:Cytochrome c-type protein n=1 Tax=Parendozoicomonas callyspongiae TaxID=2942213 RepID=A0ABT0PBN1_9GAMM|nr:NapC/NirT family cytochrome c [Sansalvadorimonas sp. 2012CJ34-2]MCL6268787.1 NapC/NirT family cytochrome c [Sansalvadorimonas sp. 2012CJ34-2]
MLLIFSVGILVVPAFQFSMDVTGSNQFCSSCHLKMDTVVQEYQESIHFSNRTGIKATCSDCHIPNEFLPAMKVKFSGLIDTYHYLTQDFPREEFESRRWDLFEKSLDSFREHNSSTCKNCHNINNMSTQAQTKLAAHKHNDKQHLTKTCVDCHTGSAHKLPELDFLDLE